MSGPAGKSGQRVKRKWRPSLGLIIALMLVFVLTLPLMGVFFFRIYENQLVRQTEAELIGQSAVLAALVRREVEALPLPDAKLGALAPQPPKDLANGPYRPILPTLDLTSDDLRPSRPPASPAAAPVDPVYQTLGARMAPVLVETQRVTLAGFRLLDPRGDVIAGREELGLSLANVEEVAGALRGNFRSMMRLRNSEPKPPPLYSFSRGTGVRIFTAMPVVVRGRVAAVIYASRTPSNVFDDIYEERNKAALAALSIAALTLLIGFAFHRTISGPMRELLARTSAIAAGDRRAIRPLSHHGTVEIAALTQGFLDMARSLAARSDFIATFASHVSHELKSPLTSIQGAAELLRDDVGAQDGVQGGPQGSAMGDQARRRFLDNILADTRRLTAIVNRLRELARAEAQPTAGATDLHSILASLRASFPALAIDASGDVDCALAISGESLRIVLEHLADNSVRHGAGRFAIEARRSGDAMQIFTRDDGAGVSSNNRARIFDSFFTTRREGGGTGMGLAIVRAMLAAHGGTIDLAEEGAAEKRGATFQLRLPLSKAESSS